MGNNGNMPEYFGQVKLFLGFFIEFLYCDNAGDLRKLRKMSLK
jgi:hypothetical protein